MNESRLVDREDEVERLRALASDPGPQLALLYGRRRVGKTHLLQHAWQQDRQVFYFLAGDVTSERNRQDLLVELGEWSDRKLEPENFPNWRMTFRELVERIRGESVVVVLDEFQYMMGETEAEQREVTSQLNAAWDQYVEPEQLDVTLVLCGSEIGTMRGLTAGGPLYGRMTWSHNLQPFDYIHAREMLGGRSMRETCQFYGVFGGMPEYLDAVSSDESLEEAVVRTMLSPDGEVHLQLEQLMAQEGGIRKPRSYRSVLEAIAAGCTETNEIKQRAFGSDASSHQVRNILGTLEELGLVHRTRNFGAGDKATIKNRLADPAVRFWYRFVHAHRTELQRRTPAELWENRISGEFSTYMGGIFESIVEQAYFRHHDRWGLPGAIRWGRWEGTDRQRRSIEIDIVAELDDRTILTGEIKWSSSPVDLELHEDHIEKLAALAESGNQWAHRAREPDESSGHLYVSAAGFTPRFERRAEDDEQLTLVELPDLA